MSRYTFSSNEFQIYIGVDDIVSTFITVYKLKGNRDDPILDADSLRTYYAGKFLNEVQLKACKMLKDDMEAMVKAGVPHPNINPRHISSIAQAFGVKILPGEIHRILD